jgi:translation initiation factor 2B subunit (eIF-2B alpha/beta/delta family)
MKLASEEARAHPNRTYNVPLATANGEYSNQKSQNVVHDKKLTFCLEAYIQWFNRLTFFITTEIVKHTQRRSRIRLINYFIDAAYECFRLKNFNSMIGILGKRIIFTAQNSKETSFFFMRNDLLIIRGNFGF